MAYSTAPVWAAQQVKFETQFNALVATLPTDRQQMWKGKFEWHDLSGVGVRDLELPTQTQIGFMFKGREQDFFDLQNKYRRQGL